MNGSSRIRKCNSNSTQHYHTGQMLRQSSVKRDLLPLLHRRSYALKGVWSRH